MIVQGMAAAGAVAAVFAACGGDPEPAPRASAPPTSPSTATRTAVPRDPAAGNGRLVLRWRLSGGLAGLGGPGSVPDFSLYGDGRAIAKESKAPAASPLALREYRLRPAALRRLISEARAAGLDKSRSAGPEDEIADGFVVEVRFGAARTRITQPGPFNDKAVRFHKRLQPETWPASDLTGPSRAYEPDRVALLTGEVDPAVAAQRRAERWPLRPLGGGERAGGGLCTALAGPDARAAVKLARDAKPGTIWRSGGKVHSVRFRPLLPDERSCRTLAG